MHRGIVILLMIIVGQLATSSRAAEELDFNDRFLREHGIETNTKSVDEYLRSLLPSGESKRRIDLLVEQLADPVFARREDAMRRLMRAPQAVESSLAIAAKRGGPEMRWRVKLIQKERGNIAAQILRAVLVSIQKHKLKGLAKPIVNVIPLCSNIALRAHATEALKATLRPGSIDYMRQRLKTEKHEPARIVLIRVIGELYGKQFRSELYDFLDDKSAEFRLVAACSLANIGDAKCLVHLVDLLDANDLNTRFLSARMLRSVTGKNFGFLSYEKPEQREPRIRAWRQWVTDQPKTFKLLVAEQRIPQELSHILICLATQNKVIELDHSGRQIWEQTNIKYPWRAEGLANGHRLIASYNGKYVVEFDLEGKEVWRKDSLPGGPHSVQRLANENTLIACSDSHKVIEVRRDGSTAWEVNLPGRPTDARRLRNGMTLVTLKNAGRVVEVDQAGKVVWELSGLKWPNTAQRLDNGNTLVAEVKMGRVAEYNHDGKIVWSKDKLVAPYDAKRLANGQTLICDRQRVGIIDRLGNFVWQQKQTGDLRASRF